MHLNIFKVLFSNIMFTFLCNLQSHLNKIDSITQGSPGWAADTRMNLEETQESLGVEGPLIHNRVSFNFLVTAEFRILAKASRSGIPW